MGILKNYIDVKVLGIDIKGPKVNADFSKTNKNINVDIPSINEPEIII